MLGSMLALSLVLAQLGSIAPRGDAALPVIRGEENVSVRLVCDEGYAERRRAAEVRGLRLGELRVTSTPLPAAREAAGWSPAWKVLSVAILDAGQNSVKKLQSGVSYDSVTEVSFPVAGTYPLMVQIELPGDLFFWELDTVEVTQPSTARFTYDFTVTGPSKSKWLVAWAIGAIQAKALKFSIL